MNRKGSVKEPSVPLAGFDEFWAAYPNRKGKAKAQQWWQKNQPDALLQIEIMDGLERAKASVDWTKDDGQYVPHPTTWLNGRRWEDEYRPARPESRDTGPQYQEAH